MNRLQWSVRALLEGQIRRRRAYQTRQNRWRRLRLEALEDRRLLALDAQLVADINTLAETGGSAPQTFVEVDGLLYFTASTAAMGCELWKSDGTAAGTALVKDINYGTPWLCPS